MICPVCEGSNLEHLTIFRFWCRDCRAARDNSMFCVFVYGEPACGARTPGSCNKTQPNCKRHGNFVRFGGFCSMTLASATTPREVALRLEALGIKP